MTDYKHRCQRIQGCLDIRCLQPHEYVWLPATCAYRLGFEKNRFMPGIHWFRDKRRQSIRPEFP